MKIIEKVILYQIKGITKEVVNLKKIEEQEYEHESDISLITSLEKDI